LYFWFWLSNALAHCLVPLPALLSFMICSLACTVLCSEASCCAGPLLTPPYPPTPLLPPPQKKNRPA
jgi:hypothetical protein